MILGRLNTAWRLMCIALAVVLTKLISAVTERLGLCCKVLHVLSASLENRDGRSRGPQRPHFVPPVTAPGDRRRGATGADRLVSRPAVPNRTALGGDYFLLARRAEIAQLRLLPWIEPVGGVGHRTLGDGTRSVGILTLAVCSTLVLAKAGA